MGSKIRAAAYFMLAGLMLLAGMDTGRAQEKAPGSAADIAFWNSVKDAKNPAELKAYLDAFPNGMFADLAKIRLQDLQRAPAPTANMPPGSVLTDPQVIREVQEKLYNLNYDLASVNGRLTEETQRAIREWQRGTNRPMTGDLDTPQLAALRAAPVPATWGALAYSARGASGVVWNRGSRLEAERDAMLECHRRGGSSCKVIAGADGACGALGFYTGRSGSNRHWGAYVSLKPTLAQAVDHALSECRRQARTPEACGVRITFCADGSHKQ